MAPELKKIVLNMGLGLDGNDNKIIKSCEDDLGKIKTWSSEVKSILNRNGLIHLYTQQIFSLSIAIETLKESDIIICENPKHKQRQG